MALRSAALPSPLFPGHSSCLVSAVFQPFFLLLFLLCPQPGPALAGQASPCPPGPGMAPAPPGLPALRLPWHPLQRQGLVRRTAASQEHGPAPLAPGPAQLPEPRREARDRLAAIPSFPAAELLDLLAQVPAVRLAGTPDQGQALLVAFIRRDCPACGALCALLGMLAPAPGFPVGFVPAGSARQARTFYQMPPPAQADAEAPAEGLARGALDALASRQPAIVRRFVEARSDAPRLPLLCWAVGGRARLASLGAQDALALIWLLGHDPASLYGDN